MERVVEYDIALSFAGEDRQYVDDVANILKSHGVSVFYDKFEEANLWGKNLYDYLNDIYQNKARYTIMFISEHYNKKLWPNHERQAMQSRAFQENQEYILPARFDETEIPGLFPTVYYISLRDKPPSDFAKIIFKKLVESGRTIPSENVRKSLSTLIKVPKVEPSTFQVTLQDENGTNISGSSLVLIADNNTYLKPISTSNDVFKFTINVRRNYKLYFAHPNFPAFIAEKIDTNEDVELKIHSSENIGSIICHSTCRIPGLTGRLNPILDTSFRTYLYADNIAINGGKQQPTTFKLNEPIDLEDNRGIIMQLTVRDMQGRSSLLEYVKPVME